MKKAEQNHLLLKNFYLLHKFVAFSIKFTTFHTLLIQNKFFDKLVISSLSDSQTIISSINQIRNEY